MLSRTVLSKTLATSRNGRNFLRVTCPTSRFHVKSTIIGLHTDTCISGGSVCTSPVFAYTVVPLESFGMVPVSGRCEGVHKKVLRKTAPLSRIARLTHSYRMASHSRVERHCKLLRGMWGIETCIYKTAGKSSSSPCSLRAASLEKFTGSFHCGNYTLECSYVESFHF